MSTMVKSAPGAAAKKKNPKKQAIYIEMGERIRTVRLARRQTQDAVAEACGVSRAAVAQWENGFTKPEYDNLEIVAKFLAARFEWLYKGEGPPPEGIADKFRVRAPRKRLENIAPPSGKYPKPDYPGVVIELVSGIGIGAQPGDDVHDWWRLPMGLITETLRSRPENLRFFRVGADDMVDGVRKGDRVAIDVAKVSPVDGSLFAIDNGIGYLLKRLSVTGDGIMAGAVAVDNAHIVGQCVLHVKIMV